MQVDRRCPADFGMLAQDVRCRRLPDPLRPVVGIGKGVSSMRALPPLVAVVVGLALVAGPGRVAAAQSPAASPVGPVACSVAPRPVDQLVALWFAASGTPIATPPPASPVAAEAHLPQGAPADPATVAAVSRTLAEIDDCFAANQFARAFALMSDRLVQQFGPDLTDPNENTPEKAQAVLAAQLATPPTGSPVMSEPSISAPRAVRMLPDGRVGGLVSTASETAFAIFVQQNGQWLLDDLVPVAGPGATPRA
jgi:hypothetical protein